MWQQGRWLPGLRRTAEKRDKYKYKKFGEGVGSAVGSAVGRAVGLIDVTGGTREDAGALPRGPDRAFQLDHPDASSSAMVPTTAPKIPIWKTGSLTMVPTITFSL